MEFHLKRFLVQIDDFYTDDRIDIDWLVAMPVDVRLSALLSKSRKELLRVLNDIPGVSVGVHGWNHFIEPQFGYWEARHLLETADSWECFDKFFVMPWNRMPKVGFLRAMKEIGYKLVTPYKWQAWIASVCGCGAEHSMPILLHPPDFLLRTQETKEEVQAKWEEWK
jgi:hypothetical protein